MKKYILIVLAAFAMSGCSEQAREDVSTSLDSAASSIGRATEDALDTIGNKMENVGNDSANDNRDTLQTRTTTTTTTTRRDSL